MKKNLILAMSFVALALTSGCATRNNEIRRTVGANGFVDPLPVYENKGWSTGGIFGSRPSEDRYPARRTRLLDVQFLGGGDYSPQTWGGYAPSGAAYGYR